MEENWVRYNTLLDAITALESPSEANQWMKTACMNEGSELSIEETEIFERLLPKWHRDFLQYKHYPSYAIKTSLARLVCREEDAKALWNDVASICLLNTPSALSIINLSMLVYPLIELAIYRRQLCQSIIFEIKRGNLKPYFYPESLEKSGLSDREKLQAFIKLPLTEQALAKIEISELGSGLTTTETFQRQAHRLWKRYHDRARGMDKPETPPAQTTPPKQPKKEETIERNKDLNVMALSLWGEGYRSLKDIATQIENRKEPGISHGSIQDIIRETVSGLKGKSAKT